MKFQDLSRQVRLEKLVPLLRILHQDRRHIFVGEEKSFKTRSISEFPVGGVRSKAAEQQQQRQSLRDADDRFTPLCWELFTAGAPTPNFVGGSFYE